MAFDYKKEYKEYYLPKSTPQLVTVPAMNYLAVQGQGDPNAPEGDYQKAVGRLYGMAYTIKMSPKAGRRMEGYFDYVVPPLEGFWWQPGVAGVNLESKQEFHWISVIRLPDFVTRREFDWAAEEAERKKKQDFSAVRFWTVTEGLCVQMMHVGPFDEETATVAQMDAFLAQNGYENDFSSERLHHEIYLSDARRVPKEKWKTVIRHPVRPL